MPHNIPVDLSKADKNLDERKGEKTGSRVSRGFQSTDEQIYQRQMGWPDGLKGKKG